MNLKRLFLGLLLACLLAAQVVAPFTIADITGDAAKHQIAASGTARWFEVSCPSTNSAAVRIGDTNISSSRGTSIFPGTVLVMPPLPIQPQDPTQIRMYVLSNWYYLAGSGDKLQVMGVR